MQPTRRGFLAGSAAVLGAMGTGLGAPSVLRAQTAPSAARTLRAVMHADLRVFDPIWTTANITGYHGAMVYDMLFGIDANFQPQPQMVARYGLSDDKLTHSFELRDGLTFSDGTPVTAADCIASIRRWAARDGAGMHMFERVKDTQVVDDKTFRIVMTEPYGLMLHALSKAATSICVIMRKKEAETDPKQQIKDIVGSGPFIFNQQETRPGNRYVYDRNPNYVPRAEPASGIAGGKVVKLDRVIYENITDPQTALGALQAGEIDFFEVPPQDLLGQLESDPNLTTQILNKTGSLGWMRMNFLHPPFDNVYARRAMLHLINQEDVMKAAFGTSKYWQKCGAYFGCGTDMENDANTGWLKEGQNIDKAKALFKQAGYDGRPVVILHAASHYLANPAGLLVAQWLREAGVNVDLVTSDWGAMLTRRNSKKPPAEGGWNIFFTAITGYELSDPVSELGQSAAGENAWYGWPTNARQEELRAAWAKAPTLEQRQAIARQMQENGWDYVQHVFLGQFFRAAAWRKNVKGVIGIPALVPFWNIEKTA